MSVGRAAGFLRKPSSLAEFRADREFVAYRRLRRRPDDSRHTEESSRRFPGPRHSEQTVLRATSLLVAKTFRRASRHIACREMRQKSSAAVPSGGNSRKVE